MEPNEGTTPRYPRRDRRAKIVMEPPITYTRSTLQDFLRKESLDKFADMPHISEFAFQDFTNLTGTASPEPTCVMRLRLGRKKGQNTAESDVYIYLGGEGKNQIVLSCNAEFFQFDLENLAKVDLEPPFEDLCTWFGLTTQKEMKRLRAVACYLFLANGHIETMESYEGFEHELQIVCTPDEMFPRSRRERRATEKQKREKQAQAGRMAHVSELDTPVDSELISAPQGAWIGSTGSGPVKTANERAFLSRGRGEPPKPTLKLSNALNTPNNDVEVPFLGAASPQQPLTSSRPRPPVLIDSEHGEDRPSPPKKMKIEDSMARMWRRNQEQDEDLTTLTDELAILHNNATLVTQLERTILQQADDIRNLQEQLRTMTAEKESLNTTKDKLEAATDTSEKLCSMKDKTISDMNNDMVVAREAMKQEHEKRDEAEKRLKAYIEAQKRIVAEFGEPEG